VRDGVIARPTRVFTPGFEAGAVAGFAVLRVDPAIVAPERTEPEGWCWPGRSRSRHRRRTTYARPSATDARASSLVLLDGSSVAGTMPPLAVTGRRGASALTGVPVLGGAVKGVSAALVLPRASAGDGGLTPSTTGR
jgi:hypothetical protein